MRMSRRRQPVNTIPARIEMDAECVDLKAQAEGRAAFRSSEYYERIHERASADSKSIWKLMPSVRLKFQFYMAARNMHEALKESSDVSVKGV